MPAIKPVQKIRHKEEKIILNDRRLINKALRKYLNSLEGPKAIREAIGYAIFPGGKRLRPILALECCKIIKWDKKSVLPAACAIEFAHNFSLVHDDLPAMDNDDFRRGKLSVHKRFGEAIAVLAGDALLNLAYGVLAQAKTIDAGRAIYVLCDTIGTANMLGGQALDIKDNVHKRMKRNIEREIISRRTLRINSMKTAALIAASCKLGAMASRADSRKIDKLHKFGISLGMAFQVVDDAEDTKINKTRSFRIKNKIKLFYSDCMSQLASFGEKADTLRYIAEKICSV